MVAADARIDSGSRRSTRSPERTTRFSGGTACAARRKGRWRGCGTVRRTLACAPKPRVVGKIRQRLHMEGRKCGQVRRGKFNDGGTR